MSERNVMNLTRWIRGGFADGSLSRPLITTTISGLFQRAVLACREEVEESQIQPQFNRRFHLRIAFGCLAVLLVSFLGCRVTSIHADVGERLIAVILMFAMVAPLPLYWHEKGRTVLREASVILPYELSLAAMLSFPVLIAARLRLPLQDSLFGHIDQSLGVSVPAIMTWADHHWLGSVINNSYPYLLPFLAAAALIPPLVGHMRHAREFLVANLAAFGIGVPLFALLPAVGPWYYYHLKPYPSQAACWQQLISLRLPAPYLFQDQAAGIVCFPSFHVVWAILCAAALWGFRPLRIPIVVLSALIIASTLTTGWHYFSDVLGGAIVAIISMMIAKAYAT